MTYFTQAVSQCLQTINVSSKGVEAVVQLRSGALVIASNDCQVYLFALEGPQYVQKDCVQIKNTPHTIGYDFKREEVYVGCAWGTVEQIDVREDKLRFVQTHKWSKREISHVTWRMDADVVLSSGFDGVLTVYQPKTQRILSQTPLVDSPVRYLRYDDVGGVLYVGTHQAGIPVFQMLEPEKGDVPVPLFTLGLPENARYFHKDPVRCICFDPRSRYMFSCDHSGKILVWHAGTAGCNERREALGQVDGHLGSKLRAMCWLHGPRALLSAGEDGKILVHNVGQRKTCGQWQAHQDELMGIDEIRFGTAGDHVMSWAKDGRVCIWRLTFRAE